MSLMEDTASAQSGDILSFWQGPPHSSIERIWFYLPAQRKRMSRGRYGTGEETVPGSKPKNFIRVRLFLFQAVLAQLAEVAAGEASFSVRGVACVSILG